MTFATAVATRVSTDFRCHLCDSESFRIVVLKAPKQSAAVSSVSSVAAYACTNRVPTGMLQVVECTSCQLRALHPAPPAHDVEEAYTVVEDPDYLAIEAYREYAFARLLEHMHTWRKPPGRLLDVGCHTGLFSRAAQNAGWDAYGIEPSTWAAHLAEKRLPGKITSGFLDTASFEEQSFDVVTSWDVIEHVTDPKAELQRMMALLRPGGWLFLSTMRSNAPIVRLLGRHWPWYMEMHRFYFTPATLTALLTSVGLEARGVAPYVHYTSPRYIFWKLETTLGPLARAGLRVARALRAAERPIRIDLGDFFLIAAQRRADATSVQNA